MLKAELESIYLDLSIKFINKLNTHKENQGSFSFTLDAQIASN